MHGATTETIGLVIAVLVAIPAAVVPFGHDLVKRPTRVSPLWWTLPVLVLVVGWVGVALYAAQTAPGQPRLTLWVKHGSTVPVVAMVALAIQVTLLALSRRLRPGDGPTMPVWPVMARVAAAALCIAMLVLGPLLAYGTNLAAASGAARFAALLVFGLPEHAWWALLLVCVALADDRPRVRSARQATLRATATMLGLWLVHGALVIGFYALGSDWTYGGDSKPAASAAALILTSSILATLWRASRPWSRWVVAPLAATIPLVGLSPAWQTWTFARLPAHITHPLPVWRSLDGPAALEPQQTRSQLCEQPWGYCTPAVFARPEAPVAALGSTSTTRVLALGDGSQHIPVRALDSHWWELEIEPLDPGTLRLREYGSATFGHQAEWSAPLSVDAAAPLLRDSRAELVTIRAGGQWTVQQAIEVCATVPNAQGCRVLPWTPPVRTATSTP